MDERGTDLFFPPSMHVELIHFNGERQSILLESKPREYLGKSYVHGEKRTPNHLARPEPLRLIPLIFSLSLHLSVSSRRVIDSIDVDVDELIEVNGNGWMI